MCVQDKEAIHKSQRVKSRWERHHKRLEVWEGFCRMSRCVCTCLAREGYETRNKHSFRDGQRDKAGDWEKEIELSGFWWNEAMGRKERKEAV